MKAAEKITSLALVDAILALDITNIIQSNNPNAPLSEFLIQGFSAIQLISDLESALGKLKIELQKDTWVYLSGISSGNRTVSMTLKVIRDSIQGNDLDSLYAYTGELIRYEMNFGFWERFNLNDYSIENIEQQKQKINSLFKRVTVKNEEFDNLISKSNDLFKQRSAELDSLTSQLSKATNEAKQITVLWEQATRQQSEIGNVLAQSKDSLNSGQVQIDNQKEDFNKLKEGFDAASKKLNSIITEAKATLDSIAESEDEIQSKTEEAKRLLGLSADAALGGRFSQREIKVSKALKWWFIGVCASVSAAIAWAVVVFLCLRTETSLPYLDFFVNLLKTSPGFVLMGYVMAQYNKERAIQEEYAFRSAIAETISAYADLLENQDDADKTNESRQKMLLNAIKQVYSKPVVYREKKSDNMYKEFSKELLEILKQAKSPNTSG